MSTASELYDSLVNEEVEFNTDSLFNQRAPAPLLALAVGGILSVIGFALWVSRFINLRKQIEDLGAAFEGSLLVRAMISAMVDEDDRFYAIISFSAISFLVLGCLQLDYYTTVIGMFVYYILKASLEALRTLLGFWSAKDLSDVVVTSKKLKSEFQVSTEIQPLNVYGDLSCGITMVLMVFITQLALIYLVIASLLTEDGHLTYCWDYTWGCPVVGTLGSWSLYILGTLAAMVYKLGPQTSFGHSPQNPAFWLQLFLAGKHKDSTFTWLDPIKNETKTSKLLMSKVWFRYILSFIINGIGFHFLVHSLPINVGKASDFYGVVWAASGMMWLVDMDYLWGNVLTVSHPTETEEAKTADNPPVEEVKETPKADEKIVEKVDPNETVRVSAEALKIINEARAKLDALAKGEKGDTTVPGNANHNLTAGALLHVPTEQTDTISPGASSGDESRSRTFGDHSTAFRSDQIYNC